MNRPKSAQNSLFFWNNKRHRHSRKTKKYRWLSAGLSLSRSYHCVQSLSLCLDTEVTTLHRGTIPIATVLHSATDMVHNKITAIDFSNCRLQKYYYFFSSLVSTMVQLLLYIYWYTTNIRVSEDMLMLLRMRRVPRFANVLFVSAMCLAWISFFLQSWPYLSAVLTAA